MQVRSAYPDHSLAFAHAVQKAHFIDGHDLNDPRTYDFILEDLGLDLTIDLPSPYFPSAALQQEYDVTRALGISSFPTIMIMTGSRLETLSSKYDPADFSSEVSNRFPV